MRYSKIRLFQTLINLIIPALLYSASDTTRGIKFDRNLTWTQLIEKAKAENKYIFVDYFATWCVPCKKMDSTVFLSDKVGDYYNSKFISIKIQMDTTRSDDEYIKSWYYQAHRLLTAYKINRFPHYLFFSPDGKVVHKGIGIKGVNDFISLAKNALIPSGQYYSLLEEYDRGLMDRNKLLRLARLAFSVGDNDKADQIAKDCIDNYLIKGDTKELYSKETIQFIASFTRSSKDSGFKVLYSNPDRIDSILNSKGYAWKIIDRIIAQEDIYPRIWKGGNPSEPISSKPAWSEIQDLIRSKYNPVTARRAILDAKIVWYTYRKEWEHIASYQLEKVNIYGLDTTGYGKFTLNGIIWDVVVEHVADKKTIQKAIRVMKEVLGSNPTSAAYMDTYASLLYKNGDIRKALSWEEKAYSLSQKDEEIRSNLENMKQGKKYWTSD